MKIGDTFDRGADYRLLCDFLISGQGLSLSGKDENGIHDDSTPAQCAIRAMRKLIDMEKEKESLRLQVHQAMANAGPAVLVPMPDDLLATKILQLESRIEEFGKTVGVLHSRVNSSDTSTIAVLNDFHKRQEKDAELVNLRFDNLCKAIADLASDNRKEFDSLGRGVERHQVAFEKIHFDVVSRAEVTALMRRCDELSRQLEALRAEPAESLDVVISPHSTAPIFEVGDIVRSVRECKSLNQHLCVGVGYENKVTAWAQHGVGNRIALTIEGLHDAWDSKDFELVSPLAPAIGPPTDDDKPITEEWLVKSGLRQHRVAVCGIVRLGDKLLLRQSSDDVWEVSGQSAIEFRTRRDIRLFAELMRIELKETE